MPRRWAAATATAAALAVCVAFGSVLAHSMAAHPTTDPVAAVVVLCAAAGLLVSLRLVTCAGAVTVALVLGTHGRPSSRVTAVALLTCPRLLRPVVGGLLLGGVVVAGVSPAMAAVPQVERHMPAAALAVAGDTSSIAGDGSSLPAPGWHPTAPPRTVRPPAAGVSALVTGAPGRTTLEDEVVVRRGDTLWHLAARSLGAGCTDAEIAAEWPRWWHANAAAVGANPDLILPGTRLTAPGPPAHTRTVPEEDR